MFPVYLKTALPCRFHFIDEEIKAQGDVVQ